MDTVAGLLQQLEEDLLGTLAVLALQLDLGLHLLAHILEHLDEGVLTVLTGLLLNVKAILDLDNLLVDTLDNRVLLGLTGAALLQGTIGVNIVGGDVTNVTLSKMGRGLTAVGLWSEIEHAPVVENSRTSRHIN